MPSLATRESENPGSTSTLSRGSSVMRTRNFDTWSMTRTMAARMANRHQRACVCRR